MTGLAPKRKAEQQHPEGEQRKSKGPKKWRVPRREAVDPRKLPATIEPGDQGIWATCARGQEGKCTGELRDLFEDYARKLYPDAPEVFAGTKDAKKEHPDSDEQDIEAAIHQEVQGMTEARGAALIQPIRIDVSCVLFFRTRPPIDPVQLVTQICQDAAMPDQPRRCRYANRLTPMTAMARAIDKGLEEAARAALAKPFHTHADAQTYAIRPSIRSHATLKRDAVIDRVAALVGAPHRVDLSDPDLTILIEIYQNICGMAVVDRQYGRLKRFNLTELYSSRTATAPAALAAPAASGTADGAAATPRPNNGAESTDTAQHDPIGGLRL